MYGPRPIRFPAHWCADHSKYRGFLAGGISTASSLILFFGTRLRRQNFNLAPTQYRQLRRLLDYGSLNRHNLSDKDDALFQIKLQYKLGYRKKEPRIIQLNYIQKLLT